MAIIRRGIIGFGLVTASALGAWQDDIGYTALKGELGAAMPKGAAISVSQVEGDETGIEELGEYLPNRDHPEFVAKSITDRTGGGLVSTHATGVGRYFYGTALSPAPGIAVIDCYEAGDWLSSGLLRTWGEEPPRSELRGIQNHSWVGSYNSSAVDADALRRLDLVIDRDGVVVCAGVNNGAGTAMPKLMCSSYNCIAVGLASGASSYGPTLVDGSGRVKPDLVSAGPNATSYTTPIAGACAAILLETEETLGALATLPPREQRSARALLTKTLLMGGSVKPAGWRKGFSTPSTDGSIPLDYRYGAGTLNIANSYHLLVAGQFAGGGTAPVPSRGWDYARAEPGSRYYFLQVPSGQVASKLSIMLAWNRKVVAPPDLDRDDDVDVDDVLEFQACVTGPEAGPYAAGCDEADLDGDGDVDQSDFGPFQICFSGAGNPAQNACRGGLTPLSADLDLRLHAANGVALGSLQDQSVSRIDNVEHLYLQNLPAGDWAIEVASDRSWPYALTWDATLAPAAP